MHCSPTHVLHAYRIEAGAAGRPAPQRNVTCLQLSCVRVPRSAIACTRVAPPHIALEMSEEEMDAEKGESDQESAFLVSPSRERRIANRRNRRVFFFGVIIALLIAITIGLGVGLGLSYGLKNESESSASSSGSYKHAAVATDAPRCSEVGVEILRKGGSAVDAAIASLLCVGVVNMHSTGIGGGGFLVYYNATSKTSTVIDHRETAPGRANYSMYGSFGGDETASLFGTQNAACSNMDIP